jgi:glycosyltransferase involved in cell wall biosynthesis
MGGLNYQINLFTALTTNDGYEIKPILFLGNDVKQSILDRYNKISGLTIIQSNVFNRKNKILRLVLALLTGADYPAYRLFKVNDIDLTFEIANFYGWRFPIKTIAWIPDLQHKRLRHYFGLLAFLKREIGFRMQILSGRHIMLSSQDAKHDFQRYYDIPEHRLHVVRFSVPVTVQDFDANEIIQKYKLPRQFFYLPNQFWRHKNHECVIHALAIAKQSGYNITVAVSGNSNDPRDPNYFPSLIRLIKKLDVEQEFNILGLIPYKDVQALMIKCISLINPSTFEGWSTTVEEAKVFGIRMLLSDINVHHEQAGSSATYFKIDDANHLANVMIDALSGQHPLDSNNSETIYTQSQRNMRNFAGAFAAAVNSVLKIK